MVFTFQSHDTNSNTRWAGIKILVVRVTGSSPSVDKYGLKDNGDLDNKALVYTVPLNAVRDFNF